MTGEAASAAVRPLAPRAALRQRIVEKLVPGMTPSEAAEAVMGLFYDVTEDITESDVSGIGDTHRQMLWTRCAVVQVVLDGGSYVGPIRIPPRGYLVPR